MPDLTQPSVGDLQESLAKCERQIGLLEQIMRLEATDPAYQQGSGGEALLNQRMGYYELQLRQERALQAQLLIAIIDKQAPDPEKADADSGYLAEERAAMEEADIIESFLKYFDREFYNDGQFSEYSIRRGEEERYYYEDVINQIFKDALTYKKRARELTEEFPGNERFIKLPERIGACIEHIDVLDKVLDYL